MRLSRPAIEVLWAALAKFRRGNSAAQRGFVAGVGDNCGRRRHFSGK
jgi:hypothetical protein